MTAGGRSEEETKRKKRVDQDKTRIPGYQDKRIKADTMDEERHTMHEVQIIQCRHIQQVMHALYK